MMADFKHILCLGVAYCHNISAKDGNVVPSKCWIRFHSYVPCYQIFGSMQERRNSIANALELRLSCINPSKMS